MSSTEVNRTSTATSGLIQDISQEGSDTTRDIYVLLFKDRTRRSSKSMPDVGQLMHQDIGEVYLKKTV
jgi:hypothetical protein